LRRSIDTAIQEVVNFLKDSNPIIRFATAKSLSELSDRGETADLLLPAFLTKMIAEFQPLILTAIPELLTLLNDSDINVCKACVTALSKLSEQGKPGNLSNLALLIRIIAEFRTLIGPAILDMVKSVNDDDSNVRLVHINALSKLSQQGKRGKWSSLAFLMEVIAEFRPAIATIIPAIVVLLNDSESSVRVACAEALSTLSEQGNIYSEFLEFNFAHHNRS
jgi:HEAT repeat protein